MTTLHALLQNELPQSSNLNDLFIAKIESDSRQVGVGTLFFALPGTKTNGMQYIEQAVMQGAACVVAPASQCAGLNLSVPLILVDDCPRAYAKACARFFAKQPRVITAVTGTNGKTSVSVFLREIWQAMGQRAASIGTIGLISDTYKKEGSLTTPDAKVLHQLLRELHDHDVSHVALEASSHGLVQRRLDGVKLACGGFTNLTRDHLDYHGTMEAYRSAKLRLFDTLLEKNTPAVIAADGYGSDAFMKCAEEANLDVWTVGIMGTDLTLLGSEIDGFGTLMDVDFRGRDFRIKLPLAGTFQIENALVAAGMAIAVGGHATDVFLALEHLVGAPGRLERVAQVRGAHVIVDYAHTPDALREALQALRPYTQGKLHVVFGCGGDRDKGKRPLMGKVAVELADGVIVTDDNPRTEDAKDIRTQVLEGAVGAVEIADRKQAIGAAMENLQAGDVLLIAGKGHEQGQIVGTTVLPFCDKQVAQALAAGIV